MREMFRNLSSRTVELLIAVLAGMLVGYLINELVDKTRFSSEAAQILGSAIGASIAVLGAIWVARNEAHERDRINKVFIGDAAAAMRDEAFMLLGIVGDETWDEHEKQAEIMTLQMERLKEVLDIFQTEAPVATIMSYQARLWISRLKRHMEEDVQVIESELDWLKKRASGSVVDIARGKMKRAATRIFEGCERVCKEIEYVPKLPTAGEVTERFKQLAEEAKD